MGQKYSTVSVSGYNATPPSDDGSITANNQVTWAKHKTKIGDPLKTAIEAVNTALVAQFDEGPVATSAAFNVTASDFAKVFEATGTFTAGLVDATTGGAGLRAIVKNVGTGTVTVKPNTATDTFEGTVNGTVALSANQAVEVMVNTAADGWLVISKSSTTTGFESKGRNWLRNGSMNVHQRNSGLTTSISDGYFCSDMWRTDVNGSPGTYEFSWMEEGAANQTLKGGCNAFQRITMTVTNAALGSTDLMAFAQRVTVDRSAEGRWMTGDAKALTASFYARVSAAAASGVYGFSLGNGTTRSWVSEFSVGTTWERFEFNIPADTVTSWGSTTGNSGSNYHFRIALTCGSAFVASAADEFTSANEFASTACDFGAQGASFDITGCQLEAAATATAFELTPFSEDLAECQRFFQKSYNYDDGVGATGDYQGAVHAASTVSNAGGMGIGSLHFSPEMYYDDGGGTYPQVVIYSPNNGTAGQGYNYTTSQNLSVSINSGVGENSTKGAFVTTTTGGAGDRWAFHWTAEMTL